MKTSAGFIVFRVRRGVLELLLGHMGGPYWARRTRRRGVAWFDLATARRKVVRGQVALFDRLAQRLSGEES